MMRARRGVMALLLLASLGTGAPSADAALLEFEYAAALNHLGQMRMLAQRLAKQNVVYQLHLDDPQKYELVESARKLGRLLESVREGRPLLGVPRPPNQQVVDSIRAVETAWTPVERMALASPYAYLRGSREFIAPRDRRGDPLLLVHFDRSAETLVSAIDETSALYVAACEVEGYPHCAEAGRAGLPAMLTERLATDAILVFAHIAREERSARLVETRERLTDILGETGAHPIVKATVDETRGPSGRHAAELWEDVMLSWRRLGRELDTILADEADAAAIRRALDVQGLLVGDLERLARTLEQFALAQER